MPEYRLKALSSEVSDTYRLLDPAIVAAALLAGATGKKHFTVPIIFRLAVFSDDVFRFVGRARGFAIASDGTIVDAAEPETLRKMHVPIFVPIEVELPALDPEHTASVQELFSPVWTALQDNGNRAELAYEFRPALNFSVPSIHARPQELPALPLLDGRGVLMGVIDWGCDFRHRAFRHPDGTTRLSWLWDQNGAAPSGGLGLGAPPSVNTLPGVIFNEADLNRALSTPDPYWAAGYDPVEHPYNKPMSGQPEVVHGTHVLGTASGSAAAKAGAGRNWAGMAPGADLAFVHLRPNGLAEATVKPNGGDVLQGVAKILSTVQADQRPCVVNLSMGNNSGPHDGTSVLEQALDAAATPAGRAIVVSAGNTRDDKLHAAGTVSQEGPSTLTWVFAEDDKTLNTMDIWYEALQPEVIVSLKPQNGAVLKQTVPTQGILIFDGGKFVGSLLTESLPPQTPRPHDLQHIRLELWPSGHREEWKITLSVAAGALVRYDAWIDRSDVGQSSFAEHDAERSCTLGSLACGTKTLSVGAYYEIPPGQPAAYFSSEGPTRDGRLKPDLAAPGFEVLAPRAKGGLLKEPGAPDRWELSVAMSGTSVSAPHVAGLAALFLQMQPTATGVQLRDWIASHTQLCAPTVAKPATVAHPIPRSWNVQLGFGRIDAAAGLWAAWP